MQGDAIVAPLVAQIRSVDYSRIGPRGNMAVLTALWLLLHDLDEQASRTLLEELIRAGELHPIYKQRLMTITSFTMRDYLRARCNGVDVLTLNSLPGAPVAAAKVLTWLCGVPPEDLEGIERLYVIDRTQDRYWGEYFRVLANVVVVWRGSRWLRRLRTEFTVYHEIGHHLDPNLDGPKTEAEAFADRYAWDRFAMAHRMLTNRTLRKPTTLLLMGSRWRSSPPWATETS